MGRRPTLDVEQDLKGATPESLAWALLRGWDMPGKPKNGPRTQDDARDRDQGEQDDER